MFALCAFVFCKVFSHCIISGFFYSNLFNKFCPSCRIWLLRLCRASPSLWTQISCWLWLDRSGPERSVTHSCQHFRVRKQLDVTSHRPRSNQLMCYLSLCLHVRPVVTVELHPGRAVCWKGGAEGQRSADLCRTAALGVSGNHPQ